ncbi:MAG: HAD-IA family hydrolase [Verrucomicrobiia bacterium]
MTFFGATVCSWATLLLVRTKLFIFDFDGTVADTFAVAVEIFNELSAEFSYRPIREEELNETRTMSAKQILKRHGIKMKHLPKLAAKALRMLRERIEAVQPYDGVPEMLRELGARGHQLGILTSNSEENVRVFLEMHDLDVFDFVKSCPRLFGKARELKKIMKNRGLKPEEVLFVGDEVRDIEAGQKVNVTVAAVGWGFTLEETLRAERPDLFVRAPMELVALSGQSEDPGSVDRE